MSTKRRLSLLFLLLLAAMPLPADDWTLKSPSPKPSGRNDHAMASIDGNRVLLFGGFPPSFNDETWVYDLSDNTWTLKSSAIKPSGRETTAMAYIGGDQVLLFGGVDGAGRQDDTWVYDLSDNTWTQKSPATKPSARDLHAMAYIGGDQVLLFGGFDGFSFYGDDTWVYDLSDNTWTQKFPSTKPSARYFHAMAYIGGDQVLLFGGGTPSLNDETWVYDLSDNAWTLKTPATKPSVRINHAMASIGGDQFLLFGGYVGGSSNNDDETWVYDLSDNTWTQKSPTTKPSARAGHRMASIGGGHVLLFGGQDSAGFNSDETWLYSAPAFAAQVQQPINADGSSVFSASRGVVPVKFTLTLDGLPTCQLPPATISLVRTAGATPGQIDESVYLQTADNGSSFRIANCQYVYNLATRSLGPGSYQVQINISGVPVGSATFGLN
jgi:N-acetylneuraminic acid mutarotase